MYGNKPKPGPMPPKLSNKPGPKPPKLSNKPGPATSTGKRPPQGVIRPPQGMIPNPEQTATMAGYGMTKPSATSTTKKVKSFMKKYGQA